MTSVFELLSSRAKAGVLRTLCLQSASIPLRHVASLADLHPFSAQKALRSLVERGIVIRREKGNNILFEINRNDAVYPLLSQFFDLEVTRRIQSESERYSARAARVLKFADSAVVLFRRARKRRPAWT